MTSSIRKIDDTTVEVTVELNKEDLVGYVKQAENQLTRDLQLDGFRKGKAPQDIARKHIQEDVLREEALQAAVHGSLSQAAEQEKLDVLDQKDFSIKENTADKLLYTIILTLYPKVQLGEYKGIEIKKHPIVVADEEISAVLTDLVQSRVELHDVTRSVQKGDLVEVDFTISLDGKVIDGGESHNHPLVIGESKFVPGFEEQVIGMNVNEQKTFSLAIPADYYQKTIAGKNVEIVVTVRSLKGRDVPALDDAFAKKLGAFESLEQLKQQISEGVRMEKEEKEHERQRIEILNVIIKNATMTVPAILIERQLDIMMNNFDRELHDRGMELGPYLAHLNKTHDDIRKDWRTQAEQQVKMSLVLHAVAKAENIAVSEEETEEALQMRLQQYLVGRPEGSEALGQMDLERARSGIHASLLNNKVFDFLESQAIITS